MKKAFSKNKAASGDKGKAQSATQSANQLAKQSAQQSATRSARQPAAPGGGTRLRTPVAYPDPAAYSNERAPVDNHVPGSGNPWSLSNITRQLMTYRYETHPDRELGAPGERGCGKPYIVNRACGRPEETKYCRVRIPVLDSFYILRCVQCGEFWHEKGTGF